MRLDGIMQLVKDSSNFKEIIENSSKSNYPVSITGLSGSAKSNYIYALFEEMDSSFIIFADSDVEAKNIYEDLSFYYPQVYYFPTKEVVFYNVDAVSGDLRWERLKVIKKMLEGGKKIIVASIETLAAKFIPVELYREYTFNYSVGDVIDLEKLEKKLIQCGYEKMDIVEEKGQFAVRGGIFDIYPPTSEEPYRVELFDDEIDSIRTFNPETQRSIDKVKKIEIFPAKEVILSEENIEKGYKKISEDRDNALNGLKNKNKEIYNNLNEIINLDLERLKENWTFETIDSFITYFYDKNSCFLDFVEKPYVFINDVSRCIGKLDSVYYEFEENCKIFFQKGDILSGQMKLLFDKQLLFQKLNSSSIFTLSSIGEKSKILRPRLTVDISEITLQGYHGQFELLVQDIKNNKDKGLKTVILSGTRARGERLVNTLRDKGIESSYKDEIKGIQFGEVVITFGSQMEGFEYPDLKICVISDREVFGLSKIKSRRRPSSKKKGISKIKSFTELKLGDYVVHTNYGIGVYNGIRQLDVAGHKKDFLELTYDKGDKLYVPVEQLDLIQKYIGNEGKAPKVNKLGTNEWAKTKSKVRKSVQDIAENLVKLYAVRSTLKGYCYSKDTIWQKQFEDEFPYEETPDQITAVEDIKSDMQSDKPMDRLLCGDVGYGKTEVAVRAAFKAVMDGKQVAFLVPTTILAEQHYNNFVKRFSDFPVKVDMISRFRTREQQKETIKNVKAGNVDIIIGTHRILQKDIIFKDLGLLIIDEEQRFGVTHKEKIKNLKKNVDVLTLSATPIPRTLNMSLIGVRDISVIETPPEERYPIQTYVVEFNEQLIRDSILREMNRGGQVYFLYNRVEHIAEMMSYLSKIVPEAKIAVAHGQMTERELEKVMLDFMDHKYDVLVCTTIIETGIDIPNVNTIIIYDADRLGLSQLYQLRGRVGRSNRIAYAYFTYKKDKVLSEAAEKRLKAIKDFTELGSGFKIALRDLEIRGAGNIIGSAQHGHMAAVGYDLYCRMLESMIKLIKGDISKEPVETTIEIKIDAYIPPDYIKDEAQKIEVYKKIAAISSYEEMMDVEEELEDRFSNIPLSVYNLINISYIRSIGKVIGALDIKERDKEVTIEFDSRDRLTSKMINGMLSKYRNKIQFRNESNPVIAVKMNDIKKENLLKELKEIFEYIKSLVESE